MLQYGVPGFDIDSKRYMKAMDLMAQRLDTIGANAFIQHPSRMLILILRLLLQCFHSIG